MVWTAGQQIVQWVEFELDGHKYRLSRIITIQSAKSIAICRLMSLLGDVTTARRRRSWFFEGLYSKTRIGFIGYTLLKYLMLSGAIFHGEATQYKVENCPVWRHRGCRKVVTMKYNFAKNA
jgi:hypothetical protein